jgi:ribonucleoside-diphosphate reductase beta chain
MAPNETISELKGVQALPLEALIDAPISDLLAELHDDPPEYRDLYYRWEQQVWETALIDFDRDKEDWTRRLFPEQRKAVLWLLAGATAGERQLSRTLVAFVDAASNEEEGVFLTTQLADAARQTVLLESFGEAVDEDIFSLDVAWGPNGEIPAGKSLLRSISDVSERLRLDRDDELNLVRGIAAQHLLLQGVCALTARATVLGWLREQDACPGLIMGLTASLRDEIRHVQFGLRFLKEHAGSDDGRRALDETLEADAPSALAALAAGGADLDSIDVSSEDLRSRGARQLGRLLGHLGIEWAPEEPPRP